MRVSVPLHVLLVEDEPDHVELARRAFEGRAFRVSVAQTLAEARGVIAGPTALDLVICSGRLPDGDALELLRGTSLPVVIMTSDASERVAVEALGAGAVDCFVKSESTIAELPHTAERAVRQRRIEEALADLVAGAAAGGGEALFGELVLRLTRVLRVKYASVAELVSPGRLRTLARFVDGALTPNEEYAVERTPCADVLDGKVVCIPDGVSEAYPDDADLRSLGARSYVGTVLRSAAGEPLGLINAIHDRPFDTAVRPESVLQAFAARATAELERLRAERELQQERLFADSLLDMVASLVVVVDPQGRIVRFNRACEQTSGWSEAEARGRDLSGLLHPAGGGSETAYRGQEGRLREQGLVSFENEWNTRSGERRLISWVNRPVCAAAGVTYVIGTGTDVTERRRLEEDLRRAAVEWREAFDGLPLGVVVVDKEGRIVRANRAAVEQSGRSGWTDVIDRPLGTVASGEPWSTLCELVRQLRLGGTAPAREVADALTRRTWVVSARALGSEGAGRVVLNFQDITETVRLKEQLRQSETMAEIGSIVAGVAHEVRNPLFSISATLDAFESRFRGAEGYERYLGVLRGEIVRLTTLMKDLLDFGRPSRPDFAECRMQAMVEAAIAACAPLARRKPVEVTWRCAEGVPPVLADRARITQVLQNLIENALHFSPPGGRVELALGMRNEEDAAYVEVTVKDSGPGFEPSDLSRLFEPFFTRRRGGTGLGLSIVKRIVYDHGGEVTAENSREGGAIVRIRLRAMGAP